MTVIEVIELFKNEMKSEVYNSTLDETSKELMIQSVEDVTRTVTDTYLTENRN